MHNFIRLHRNCVVGPNERYSMAYVLGSGLGFGANIAANVFLKIVCARRLLLHKGANGVARYKFGNS